LIQVVIPSGFTAFLHKNGYILSPIKQGIYCCSLFGWEDLKGIMVLHTLTVFSCPPFRMIQSKYKLSPIMSRIILLLKRKILILFYFFVDISVFLGRVLLYLGASKEKGHTFYLRPITLVNCRKCCKTSRS